MAMNHVAIVRSSARIALHKAAESQHDTATNHSSTIPDSKLENSLEEQMSVISIRSSDGGDLAHEMSIRRSKSRQMSQLPSTSSAKNVIASPRPLTAPLEHLNTLSDIEVCVDSDLYQVNVLNKLEQKWNAISTNFETVLNHLQECSEQVTEASTSCLKSLVDSTESTCVKIDAELKALYDLMARCDELTTKLSVASSFRDEIKTLRKSVETLDNLYKSKPQVNNQHRLSINT